jgi:hypothetical protein
MDKEGNATSRVFDGKNLHVLWTKKEFDEIHADRAAHRL